MKQCEMRQDAQGFSLVSIMMAVTIILIGVVVVLAALPVGYKSLIKSRKRSEAAVLAQQQLERIKRLGMNEFYRITDQPLAQATGPYSQYYYEVLVDYVRRDVLDSDSDGSTEDFVPTVSLSNMKRVTVKIYKADPVNGGASSNEVLENTTFISGIMPNPIDNIPPALAIFATPDPGSGDITVTITSDELLGANPTATIAQQGLTDTDVGIFNYAGFIGGSYVYTSTYTLIGGGTNDGTANLNATGIDGNSNIGYASGSVEVDTVPPTVTGVYSNNVLVGSADIHWTVDEDGTYEINYGVLTPSTTVSGSEVAGNVTHTLVGLTSNTTYYYDVIVYDAAGNSATDDNGGAHYTFTTQNLTSISMTLDSAVGAGTDENYNIGAAVRILITETNGAGGLEALGSNITISGPTAGTVVNGASISAGAGLGEYYYDWVSTSAQDNYTVTVYLTDGIVNDTGILMVQIANPPIQISTIDTSVGADNDENYDPNSTVRITVNEINSTTGLEALGSSITITDQSANTVVSAAALTAGAAAGEYYYDWTVSTEETYDAVVTLTDGFTSDNNTIQIIIQSAKIVLAGGITRLNHSGHDHIRFNARNDAAASVTINTMRVVWDKPPRLYRVYSPAYTVRKSTSWPYYTSGTSFNLSSNIVFAAGETRQIDMRFQDWSGSNMNGSTTTVYLIDTDGKEYALGPISP